MLVTNTIIFMIGFVVICSIHNEPPKVEYNSHITER